MGAGEFFEHATGSGKTFTAILAIRQHLEQGLPVLVLVPSRLLLRQWGDELKEEFPDAVLLLAGAGHSGWRAPRRLHALTGPEPSPGGRIVLSTMQTAASDAFRNAILSGPHLMLVADEVHQIGSPKNAQTLQIAAGPRLGLSATPKRYGDPNGTQEILRYFNGVIPPPFSLQDAIKAGRLVPYEYYPHAVTLTASEASDWKSLSDLIRFEMAKLKNDENRDRILNERVKLLLIRRARIAKKAEKKIPLARSIVAAEYKPNQHWLVYCEDADQLAAVMSVLRDDGHQPIEYHSAMTGDHEATLSWFKTFGGVLVSIRCLDEGVDIPVVSHAIILASSQNPRQFIQRRGRVLRAAPDKHLAVIHDAIVVPSNLEDEPEQASLLRSEMLRSIQFANSAANKSAAAELRGIAADLGMTVDDTIESGIEEDDDAE